jgi:hypothetical protein
MPHPHVDLICANLARRTHVRCVPKQSCVEAEWPFRKPRHQLQLDGQRIAAINGFVTRSHLMLCSVCSYRIQAQANQAFGPSLSALDTPFVLLAPMINPRQARSASKRLAGRAATCSKHTKSPSKFPDQLMRARWTAAAHTSKGHAATCHKASRHCVVVCNNCLPNKRKNPSNLFSLPHLSPAPTPDWDTLTPLSRNASSPAATGSAAGKPQSYAGP